MEENQRSIIVVIFTFLHALRLSGFMNVEVACDYTLIIYICAEGTTMYPGPFLVPSYHHHSQLEMETKISCFPFV
jgi:hypothetical protein